jgi:hypothetical protein
VHCEPVTELVAQMAILSAIAKYLFRHPTFDEDSQFSVFHVRKPDAGFNSESGRSVEAVWVSKIYLAKAL